MKDNVSVHAPHYDEGPDRLDSGAIVLGIVILFWLVFFAAIWWVA